MLTLQNISYTHPDKDLLFSNLYLTLNSKEKMALIGNNGSGKSTLLKIIAGRLSLSSGTMTIDSTSYYVPQIFGQFYHLTIAEAVGIKNRLFALNEILSGNATEQYFNILNDDWTIEDRCIEALSFWQLDKLNFDQKLGTLAGARKQKFSWQGFLSANLILFCLTSQAIIWI